MPNDVPIVRRAGPGDVDSAVALRVLMFTAMGQGVDEERGWQEAAADWFDRHLDGSVGVPFVVDQHSPSPLNTSGRVGELYNVATFPAHRGRGHARQVVAAVLAWFDAEADVGVVRLTATDDGIALNRSLGFVEPDWTPLRRTTPPRPR